MNATLPPGFDTAIIELNSAVTARNRLNNEIRTGIEHTMADTELLVYHKGRTLFELYERKTFSGHADDCLREVVVKALTAAQCCFTVDTTSKEELYGWIEAIHDASEEAPLVAAA